MSDRPRLGSNPAEHACDECGHPATVIWGDPMTVEHGGGEWRCDVCALTEQLAFAHQRAAAIPQLEHDLRAALAQREAGESMGPRNPGVPGRRGA